MVFVARKEWREMHDFFVVQAREIQAYYQQWQAEHPGKDPGRWIYKPRYRRWTFSRTTRRRSSTGCVMIGTRKTDDLDNRAQGTTNLMSCPPLVSW